LSRPTPFTVGLYQDGGALSKSMVLLSPAAAARLVEALTTALASPESMAQAAWPRELCNFPVVPQTSGREQYLSFHLDAGAKPHTKWQLRRRQITKTLWFFAALYGFFCAGRWLLATIGV
jgi:hypothetical protein